MTFVDESRQPADHDLRQVAPKGIKLWCRRMGSLMAMSGLLYVTVALGLRFIGDGNDSGFFVPKEIDAEVYYFTNTALGDRFPSAVSAFAPNRQRFQAAKSEDTYRIFLFGESAAMGYPEPAYGVGPQLERLLDARYPGTDFEVICVTSATSDSEDILPHARDAAKLNGDAWVVYMGNNEQVHGHFALGAESTEARAATDQEDALSAQLFGHADPKRLRAYDQFANNLKRLLELGRKANVPVVLSTVTSNLLHCPPFASLNTHDLSDEELAQWKRCYEQGVNYEFDGSFEQVLAAYEAAAEIDPHHAELQFRRGLVYGKLNAFAQARTYITLARDLDALPVRPDTRLNEIIQEAAEGQADTIFLVDAMESFSNDSFAGLPGRTLFYDHVHLTLEGNYRLALLFAERISEFLPEAMKEDAMRSWIGAPLVHRQLAATDWDQHRVWSQVMKRLATAPFALRMDGSAEVAHAESQAQAFKTKHALSLGKQIYEEALRDRPSDFLLRSRYADFLTRHALQEEAEVQQEWIRVNFPDAP